MSAPENRIGGIRGPGATTLDDLLAELFQIKQASLSMQASLTQMAADVRRALGASTAPLFGSADIAQGVNLLNETLGFINTRTRGINPSPPQQGNVWASLLSALTTPHPTVAPATNAPVLVRQAWNIAQLEAATFNTAELVLQLRNELLQNPGNSQLGYMERIIRVLGDRSDAPEDVSIKELVELIRVCACEGTTPPDDTLLPEPPGVCTTEDGFGPKQRVISWVQLVTTPTETSWGAVWNVNNPPGGVILIPTALGPAQWPGVATEADVTEVDLCFSWNLPPGENRISVSVQTAQRGVWYEGGSNGAPGPGTAVGSMVTNLEAAFAKGLRVIMPTGQQPSLNYWLSVRAVEPTPS